MSRNSPPAVLLGDLAQIIHTHKEEASWVAGARQGCTAKYGRGASVIHARLLLCQYVY